ncbi:extracellular solute-binding protein [Streptomyces polygonati]|uniref:Extracellular solute-binding protein n=1 Tax=Streptomyces polygonati TaxID=1617087 RepID=A0ABV8HX22_9ACTN
MTGNTPRMDRRSFLRSAAFASVGAAGGGLLSACSSSSAGTADNAADNSAVELPAYQPYTAVRPDYPGNAQGLLNGFSGYPAHPARTIGAPPAHGGTISAFVETGSPIPPGLGSNPYWQELNKRVGAKLDLTIVPAADLTTKFATLIAGGDLPDFMVPPLPPLAGVRGLPQFLAAKCQDLTEFLSGDAVKEYPYLANITTDAWRSCVFDGGIYGLPVSRGVAGSLMFYRADLFDTLGADPNPSSYAEFFQLCKDVTDAKKGRWALVTAGSAVAFVAQMLGVPNGWSEKNGKLTSSYEDERYKQTLSQVRTMVQAGVIHPDSFDPAAPWKQWFNAGNGLMGEDRYTAWPQYYADNVAGSAFEVAGMRPPKFDGGGFAGTWQSPPVNNFTPLKKASASRIRELLSVANWLAAPFGTEEYLFRKFGLPGTDYSLRNGGPAPTQAGLAQTVLGIRYITDAPDTIFVPGDSEATKACYDYQRAIIPTSVKDPTVSLFSETYSRTGAVLAQHLSDAANDILTGRKSISSWDTAVGQWRSSGGDKMRAEFEKQLG